MVPEVLRWLQVHFACMKRQKEMLKELPVLDIFS
jgi:hypothetical protein